MNCGKFETIIIDLARADVMNAATRADAMAHAKVCARCAARLADERALTQSLRAFAAANENDQAPPQIETMIRAAFQTRPTQTLSSSPIAPANAFKARTPHHRIVWTAIAATLLVAIGLTAATSSLYTKRVAETAIVSTENSSTVLPSTSALSAQDSEARLQNTTPVELSSVGQRTVFRGTPKDVLYRSAANSAHRNIARLSDRSKRLNLGSRTDSMNDTPVIGSEEIATDFLPLVDANNLATQDGGQLVRVEMPRSALLNFGLPMNIERADEPIKADVLVGHDGLARAIRFVR